MGFCQCWGSVLRNCIHRWLEGDYDTFMCRLLLGKPGNYCSYEWPLTVMTSCMCTSLHDAAVNSYDQLHVHLTSWCSCLLVTDDKDGDTKRRLTVVCLMLHFLMRAASLWQIFVFVFICCFSCCSEVYKFLVWIFRPTSSWSGWGTAPSNTPDFTTYLQ